MMAPPTPANPSADRPELPRVRLDVRSGSGRSVSYEVGSDEFLIGAASGCDLRLPAPQLPPVVCQILRKPDGVLVRRVTPLTAVTLNRVPLPVNSPIPLKSGDTLALADFEIAVAFQSSDIIIPTFVPLPLENAAPPAATASGAFDEDRRRARCG